MGTLFCSTIAFAEPVKQYVLQKVNYPILVNGTQYTSELPVLNYDGNTYIPLKKIGDLLHCNIKWNDELKQIEIEQNKNTTQLNTLTLDKYIKDNIEFIDINNVVFANCSNLNDKYLGIFNGTGMRIDNVNYIIYRDRTYVKYEYFLNNILKK